MKEVEEEEEDEEKGVEKLSTKFEDYVWSHFKEDPWLISG